MVKICIASPCSADWNRMKGDDRVRYCPECKLNVYNFSEMSEAEIQAIIAVRTSRLCARFYQRPDMTVLTQNCPVGFRRAALRAARFASAALTMAFALTQAKSISAQSQSPVAPLVQIRSAEKIVTIEVVDAVGAAIPKAEVSLSDDSQNSVRKWITNEEGIARITNLSSGPHTFKVGAVGFAPRKLRVDPEASGAFAIRLEIGVVVMGGLMEGPVVPDFEATPIPAELKMPDPSDVPNISRPKNNCSALRRFFSKVHRVF